MTSFRSCLFRVALVCCFLTVMAIPAAAQDYTGWWWNPVESGTGFSLEVQELPDKSYDIAYMVWYAYDESGPNTWYSAIMRVTGSEMTGELRDYSGTQYGDTEASTFVGTVSLNFSDTDTGVLTFKLDGQDDTIQKSIYRWEPEGEQDNRNLTGWWWDTSRLGVGWFIEAKNDRFFMGWYDYRPKPVEGSWIAPRWYISVDNNFTQDDTFYSESLLDYSGGQTMTGEYAEPTAEAKEELLAFSLPYGETPDSLNFFYGGSSYHLTRFSIPDIFEEDCAPNVIDYTPKGSTDRFKPTISCQVEATCSGLIDISSIQMYLDGEIVQHSMTLDEEDDHVTISYNVVQSQAFYPDTYHDVTVVVSDILGFTLEYTWTFYVVYPF